jgi:hypothetical protein
MSAISICSLILAAVQSMDSATTPRLLDAHWIEGIGSVEISSPARRHLSIRIADAAGAVRVRNVELDTLGPDADIVEARAAAFMKDGILIAVAATARDTTSYHELHIQRLADQPGDAVANASSGNAERYSWSFTTPIFSSTGERYRIVDVHNSGGDTIEITYRRGWIDPQPRHGNPRLDEKIYVNVCPGTNPAVAGWLFDLPPELPKK